MQSLKFIVRRRFGASADAIGYARAADDPMDDVVLFKVLAGDVALWDSTPDDTDIPPWSAVGDAVHLLAAAVRDCPDRGQDLVFKL